MLEKCNELRAVQEQLEVKTARLRELKSSYAPENIYNNLNIATERAEEEADSIAGRLRDGVSKKERRGGEGAELVELECHDSNSQTVPTLPRCQGT